MIHTKEAIKRNNTLTMWALFFALAWFMSPIVVDFTDQTETEQTTE